MSKVDWTVMWKFFPLPVLLGLFGRWPLDQGCSCNAAQPSWTRRGFYVVAFGPLAALLSTWFPLFPVICGAILIITARHAAIESTLIAAPIVATSLGIETALVDAMLFRLLLRESVKGRFRVLLTINVTNATIALALGLAWAFHHVPRVFDIA